MCLLRSLENFEIGGVGERMPLDLIKAFAYLKKAAALVNVEFGLDTAISGAIAQAADEVSMTKKNAYGYILTVLSPLDHYW